MEGMKLLVTSILLFALTMVVCLDLASSEAVPGEPTKPGTHHHPFPARQNDSAHTHSRHSAASDSRPIDGHRGNKPGADKQKQLASTAAAAAASSQHGWMLRQLGANGGGGAADGGGAHTLDKRASLRFPIDRGMTEAFRQSASGYSFPQALRSYAEDESVDDHQENEDDADFFTPVWRRNSGNRRNKNWRSEDPNRVGVPNAPDRWAARFLRRPYQAWEPKAVFKPGKKRSGGSAHEKRYIGSLMKDAGFHGLPWILSQPHDHHEKKKRFLAAVSFPFRHMMEEEAEAEEFEPMTQSTEDDTLTDKRHLGSAIASGYIKSIGKRGKVDDDLAAEYEALFPELGDEASMMDSVESKRRKRHIGSIARMGYTPLLAAFGGQPNQLQQQLLSQYRGRTASSEEDPERRRLRGKTLEDAINAISMSGQADSEFLSDEEAEEEDEEAALAGEEDEKQKAEKVNKVLKRVLSLVQTWVKTMGKKYISKQANGADDEGAASMTDAAAAYPVGTDHDPEETDATSGLIPRTYIPIRTPQQQLVTSAEMSAAVNNNSMERARTAESKRYLMAPMTRSRGAFSSFGGPFRIPRW